MAEQQTGQKRKRAECPYESTEQQTGQKRKRTESPECPYESAEHAEYKAHWNGIELGVCEDHACRGELGCANPVVQYVHGPGRYCHRIECQAFVRAHPAGPALPPEMWDAIARFLSNVDLAYLRGASAESDAGVEERIVRRLERDNRVRRDQFIQTSAATRTNRGRRIAYLRAIPPERFEVELYTHAFMCDLEQLRLMFAAGATYTTYLARMISLGVGRPGPVLDWLEESGPLVAPEAQAALARALLTSKQAGTATVPTGMIWLMSPKRGRDTPTVIGEYLCLALELSRLEFVRAVQESYTDIRYPPGFCDVAKAQMNKPGIDMHMRARIEIEIDAIMGTVHQCLPRAQYPCAPDYCAWGREIINRK